MFNAEEQQQQHKSLDQVIDEMQAHVDEMMDTIFYMFNDENRLSPTKKRQIADKALLHAGYSKESQNKYEQWGIFDAETEEEILKIIDEVIDYRRDASLHHCN